MKEVFVVADNILSPLGNTTAENFMQLKSNISGLKLHSNASMSEIPFCAALFENDDWHIKYGNNQFTKFEHLLAASISNALQNCTVAPGGQGNVAYYLFYKRQYKHARN